MTAVQAERSVIRGWKQGVAKVRTWPPRSVVAGELELRPYQVADYEPFFASIDDEVRYWQGYDALAIQRYAVVLRAVAEHGIALPWRLLTVSRDGRFAGHYVLMPSLRRSQRWDVELGWWLAPEARGQGLGRASLAVALAHVHRDLGLRVARMGTEIANVRAVRQIEAVGATPVSAGRHTLPNGRVVDARWYHHGD